jgi:hypothetical protein
LPLDGVDDPHHGLRLDLAAFAVLEVFGDELGVLRSELAVEVGLQHRTDATGPP